MSEHENRLVNIVSRHPQMAVASAEINRETIASVQAEASELRGVIASLERKVASLEQREADLKRFAAVTNEDANSRVALAAEGFEAKSRAHNALLHAVRTSVIEIVMPRSGRSRRVTLDQVLDDTGLYVVCTLCAICEEPECTGDPDSHKSWKELL